MPIFFSMEPQPTVLRSPTDPSSLTRNLGTRNREMPFTLSGAPPILAITMWMIFSERSCSPDEMKILVPVHRPLTMFGRYLAFCSSVPLTSSAAIAPWVRPLYISKLWLAEQRNSEIAVETTCGMPCPPYSSGADKVVQPLATNWSQASLKPGGVVTDPSSLRLQPSSS